jgi:hypothetical protein
MESPGVDARSDGLGHAAWREREPDGGLWKKNKKLRNAMLTGRNSRRYKPAIAEALFHGAPKDFFSHGRAEFTTRSPGKDTSLVAVCQVEDRKEKRRRRGPCGLPLGVVERTSAALRF